ncbi:MAG: hypothetical protein H0T79_20255, partial [Deltaproteobacteria bacterium]|nr:hypothetical protein [Deltaproteobacteria bacterium]
MGSAMAIVSKAVFEKLVAQPQVGAVVELDRYKSTHRTLETLGEGGALFLVTVRPPDEQLWLVAVLEQPALGKDGWSAPANTTPIADISAAKSKLVFTSGTGITTK